MRNFYEIERQKEKKKRKSSVRNEKKDGVSLKQLRKSKACIA